MRNTDGSPMLRKLKGPNDKYGFTDQKDVDTINALTKRFCELEDRQKADLTEQKTLLGRYPRYPMDYTPDMLTNRRERIKLDNEIFQLQKKAGLADSL